MAKDTMWIYITIGIVVFLIVIGIILWYFKKSIFGNSASYKQAFQCKEVEMGNDNKPKLDANGYLICKA